MKTYFAYLGSFTQPKNQLQKEVLKHLISLSNHVIDDKDTFIRRLSNEIVRLNNLHYRCTALELSTYPISTGIGISLGSVYTVSFYLYEIYE